MSALGDLPENSLVTRLLDVQRQFRELKASPQLLTSRNVRTSRVFSGNAYDIRVTNVGYNNRVIELVFTPADISTPGLGAVLQMEYDMVVSNSGVGVYVERLVPTGGISKWRIYLNGNNTFPTLTADFKFYFFANGSGTFTATLV